MLDTVLAYVAMLLLFVVSHPLSWAIGLFAPLSLIAYDLTPDDKEPGFVACMLYRLSVVGFMVPVAIVGNYAASANLLTSPYFAGKSLFGNWLAAAIISSIAVFALLRFGRPAINTLKSKLTKRSELVRNTKTDIREMSKYVPKGKREFDPRKYFDHKRGVFVGLDENDRPVYLDYESYKVSHTLVSGRTRSGKGIAMQTVLPQLIDRGEAVVFLDPKPDKFLPHILRAGCEWAERPYHFIDLTSDVPQINVFEGCDQETIEAMMIAGFALTPLGKGADHYKLLERRAAREAAAWLVRHPGATVRDVIAELGGQWEENASGFLEYMHETATMAAICRPAGTSGIDIASIEKTGGCLYVVGDMISPKVLRLQRMILVRFMYLAKKRSTLEEQRIIRVVADEFKCHISKPFMTSLGASAGWGMCVVLGFQSLQDLAECPADLDKDAVRGGVMENSAVALSYQIKDPETREWLAASTGKVLVDDESRTVRKNLALAETVEGQRSIRQAERFYIDDNMLKSLPVPEPKLGLIGCGVLSVAGKLEQFCFTSPLRVPLTDVAITPTALPLPAAVATVVGTGVAANAIALDDDPMPEPVIADEAAALQAEHEAEQAEGGRDDRVKSGAAALLDMDDY